VPKKGSAITFKQLPFVIYADFEAIIQKIDTCNENSFRKISKT